VKVAKPSLTKENLSSGIAKGVPKKNTTKYGKSKQTSAITNADFSNFYGDEEDPDPEQIHDRNDTFEVTKMLAKMESPTRKKMKMAEKNEIEEDEDIADNRNGIDSEIWTLLEVMEVMLPKFAVPSLSKATLEKGVIQLTVIFPLQKYSCYFFFRCQS
jgi:hypothetical protein